ncbi:MAG: 5'/3'-nucleotidase SurE [Armatimonadetes bacterium]|nr:5'/3'-nucleotidase SurE [Armatimonadota bacterium]
MQILLTNDDGVRAPGLHALARVAAAYGRVVLCAPDREKSACGRGMTLRDPLRVRKADVEGGYEAYEVNGLPVDCVNLAMTEYFPKGCDLVLSGINNGPNLGWDVTYSGTVAGALEGAVNGIRSIAISVAAYVEMAPLHYESAENWLKEWLPWLLKVPFREHGAISVNVPSIAWTEIRGTKITKMGTRIYEDRVERRSDPWGREYFWQGGTVVMDSSQEGTDVQAVNDGYVSITPLRLDWTDHEHLSDLRRAFPK